MMRIRIIMNMIMIMIMLTTVPVTRHLSVYSYFLTIVTRSAALLFVVPCYFYLPFPVCYCLLILVGQPRVQGATIKGVFTHTRVGRAQTWLHSLKSHGAFTHIGVAGRVAPSVDSATTREYSCKILFVVSDYTVRNEGFT